MTDIVILSHFSIPRWPIVNKMRGVSKCLGIEMIHCSSLEILHSTMKSLMAKRVLFVTDQGLFDQVQKMNSKKWNYQLDVAIFVHSKITQFAQEVVKTPIVRYLMELDEKDTYGRHLSLLLKKFKERNILELDKYLGFGAVPTKNIIDSDVKKKNALESIYHYILDLGDPGYAHPFAEYARRATEMVDELLTNAIFGANPRMKGVDRSKPFHLENAEHIILSWGYDGEYFAVSVRDPFGQFAKEDLFKSVGDVSVADQIVQSDSAGLGLKMIFDRTHQLITNVRQRKITEVIAIVRFENRILDFEKTKKSFFYFTGEEVA